MVHPVTILIADDNDIVRKSLSYLLAFHECQVVATAENGAEAIEKVKQYGPEVILMDMRMPVMNGIEASRVLHQSHPHIGKIAFTMYPNCITEVQEMLRAGVSGFLIKDTDLAEIIRCIQTVRNGGRHYTKMVQPIVDAMMNEKSGTGNLSLRDVQLMKLIVQEASPQEMAEYFHRSVETIHKWKQELYRKCDADTLLQLIQYGMKEGIIE